jgi:hypothetical protein
MKGNPNAMRKEAPYSRVSTFPSLAVALSLALTATPARAQQLEPRAYANLPIGLNFLLAGYTYSQGDVSPILRCPCPTRNRR